MLMSITLFLKWWYGIGWKQEFAKIQKRAVIIAQELSLTILLKTLFQPWKQLVSYVPKDTSLDDKLRVIFDNLFARCFGFVIRSAVILAGILLTVISVILSIALVILWPIIPFLPLAFVYLGLFA